MDSALEAETVVRPGGAGGTEPQGSPGLGRYRRADRVRALLWRWEQASRDAGRLTSLLSARVAESNRVNRQPDMFQNVVNLVVDVERLLWRLAPRERQVVLEIAVDGRRESWVAYKLRMPAAEVSQVYWGAMLHLDERLVAGGYFA